MYLEVRNIAEAFDKLVRQFAFFQQDKHRAVAGKYCNVRMACQESRNGRVLVIDQPCTITYTEPSERVLLNPARDVNPFSLVYETMWTLAGRNDVKPIAYYTKRMTEFSDDGVTWHGAYGHRWRGYFECGDQIKNAVRQLQRDPNSRRVVLEMWDAAVDGNGNGKDYPCNTHCYVSVRDGRLDLTVCNRSNDLIWGALGANYVLFSFLTEYLAAHVGVKVGRYHQITNNLHVYCDRPDWKPDEWLAADRTEYHEPADGYTTVPLVQDPAVFDKELPVFVERNSGGESYSPCSWQEPFLDTVAQPMMTAFRAHKEKWAGGTEMWTDRIRDDAWRVCCEEWLYRRKAKKEATSASADNL